MRWIRIALALWLVLGLFPLPSLKSRAAEEPTSMAGTYRDEQVVVELSQPTKDGDRWVYTGTIQVDTRKFPLRAQAEESQFKGTFESQGDQFEFAGSVVGRTLVFSTGGTTYHLKKQAVNPLARPSKPNPLAQAPPKTNSVSVPTAPSAVSPRPALVEKPAVVPVAGQAGTLRFVRTSVMDDPSMIGGEAFSFLKPMDWRTEGGVAWRIYRSVPAYLVMRVSNPNRTEAWEVFPTIPFAWVDGGMPAFPVGSNYSGNEVAEPINDTATYVKRIILPRFRRGVSQTQVVSTEDLPGIAAAIAIDTKEPGVEKTFRAGRVRIEYTEGERVMQEDIYCVLALAYAPAIRTTLWGPERNYSFKAEKGKLEAATPVMETMVSSFQSSLRWFNRYAQLIPLLIQNLPDNTQRISDLSLYVARTSDEITDLRRHAYERQQAAQERINSAVHQYITSVAGYYDSLERRTVSLPNGYRSVWASTSSEYVFSNDLSANPNTGSVSRWQKIEKVP